MTQSKPSTFRTTLWAAPLLVAAGLALLGCNGAAARRAEPTQPGVAQVARAAAPAFDADYAWSVLLKQCEFGPRPVGSPAHRKTRDYLVAEMRKHTETVVEQDFTYKEMPLTNVIGIFGPADRAPILLCAHWDTRPTADMEIDAAARKTPIMGANDGASGVAVLLALAKSFKAQPPAVGVAVALLDGEDFGDFERDEGVFLGSRYLAKNLKPVGKPTYGILLDMIGDKDLTIFREQNSEERARPINDKVFRIASELGHSRSFRDRIGYAITDDHLPLIAAGIPTIDLIDFDYGPWHTVDDTVDRCSRASLKVVGETVGETVYREKKARPASP